VRALVALAAKDRQALRACGRIMIGITRAMPRSAPQEIRLRICLVTERPWPVGRREDRTRRAWATIPAGTAAGYL